MARTTLEKIEYIGSKKMLRLEQWRNPLGAWRAGIEWYSEDRVEFMCECDTLDKCLDKIILYMDTPPSERKGEKFHQQLNEK